MPLISSHQSTTVTKLLFVGDSGSGKTGALASLAAEGYKLRIIDTDNGLDILRSYATEPKSPYVLRNPRIAENISYVTLTEKMRVLNSRAVPSTATVWPRLLSMLDHWRIAAPKLKPTDPTICEEDLGKVTSWGSNEVLVLDTLTSISQAAFNYHCSMNGRLGAGYGASGSTTNEWRRDIGAAQAMVENLLILLKDTSIQCNVILNSHITFVEDKGQTRVEGELPSESGYPSSLGKALSPKVPQHFNTMLTAKIIGSGAGARHRIFTISQGTVATKTTNPLRVAREYDLAWGLAEYFKAVRGPAQPPQAPAAPTP